MVKLYHQNKQSVTLPNGEQYACDKDGFVQVPEHVAAELCATFGFLLEAPAKAKK